MFSKSIRLFSIFGFEVKIDLSWLIIALLIFWTLAGSLFPTMYEDLGRSEYTVMGIIGVVGLFASIIFHEFMHAIVGRRYGLPIKSITLFLLGGVAEMKDEPSNAKSEFLMAAAGPLASIVLGGFLYLLYLAGVSWEWPLVTNAVFNYLWQINLILAAFNLIPAFPLDGGRMLRSALWQWKNNLQWATKIAATVGSGFGIFLIVLGGLALLSGNPVGGIWYFVLGAFIHMMAKTSYARVMIRDYLEGETIDSIANHDPITVAPEVTVDELVDDYFYRHHHKMFPVVRENQVLGCVSTQEVGKVPREQWRQTKAVDIMQPCSEKNTVRTGTGLDKVLSRFNEPGSTRLLVMDGDKLVGIVNTTDLMKHLSIKFEIDQGQSPAGNSAFGFPGGVGHAS